jgi:glucose/arabinose dehydrogenase
MKNFINYFLIIIVCTIISSSCSSPNSNDKLKAEIEEDLEDEEMAEETSNLPLQKIKLPQGFKLSVFASDVENARSLTVSPSGTVFVGNRSEDKVYALKDTNGDGKADKKYVIASGLNMPNGVAFKDGDLYVAEVNRILKFSKIESKLSNPGQPQVIYDKFPTDKHHGWKFIAFGPDGKLYIPVGAPCNICLSKNEVYASITRMNPDGTGLEIFAHGVRNTVGFDWHPDTKEMWFTDNNRDMMGDDLPPCEVNNATAAGLHFGYPFLHGSSVKDPEFHTKLPKGLQITLPAKDLQAHVAPLGLRFYTGNMFPTEYKNNIFIAEHGSWNRSKKVGYKLSRMVLDNNNKVVKYETFADGWLDDESQDVWGRPVDVVQLKDGSLLVSDDKAGVIYRITYGK